MMAVALGILIGACFAWWACDTMHRKRQRILSNWEPGMTITTSDGERLYVCAVEALPRQSKATDE